MRISSATALTSTFAFIFAAAALVGCSTTKPKAEQENKELAGFYLRVESSEPGATVETNSVYAGKTPLVLKILGDKDGTFHDFGTPQYVVHVLPVNANYFPQTQVFNAGTKTSPGSRIPTLLFFDMSRKNGGMLLDGFPER